MDVVDAVEPFGYLGPPAHLELATVDRFVSVGHVAVDLLRPRMPRWLIQATELLGSAAAGMVFATIAGLFTLSAVEKFVSGAVVMGDVQWPSWIPDAIVALGSGTIVLRLIGRAIGHGVSLVTGRDPVENDVRPGLDS